MFGKKSLSLNRRQPESARFVLERGRRVGNVTRPKSAAAAKPEARRPAKPGRAAKLSEK